MMNLNNDIDAAIQQYESVVNVYRLHKDIDKKSVSNEIGVSMPTLYSAINSLKSLGILRESPKKNISSQKDKTKSRSENNIELVSDFAYCASISIGASLCKFVLLDLDFEMMEIDTFKKHKEKIITQLKEVLDKKDELENCEIKQDKNYIYFNTPDKFLELKKALDIIFSHLMHEIQGNNLRLLSIGIACTGVVDEKERVIRSSYNLRCIENCTLKNFFFPDKLNFFREKGIGIEMIQNCNAAVIAEKDALRKSQNKSVTNKQNIVAIYLGLGLGAGLYFDRLYTGTSGFCGEIGHLPAPYYSEESNSNKENLDKYVDDACSCGSTDCYDFKIHKYVFNEYAETFKEFSSDKIRERLQKNPKKAILLGKYLGSIVNTLTALLNVDVIVFTGKLYKSMDLLYNSIVEIQDESPLKFSRNDCVLMTSKYGPNAPAVGAAIYSYYKKYGLELKW